MSNSVGKPLLYKTVEELKAAVDAYFDYCDNRTKEVNSEKLGDMIIPDPEPYTMSGLAYWLGMDRRTLLDYSKRDRYLPTIKKARAKVEMDVERRLIEKGHAGLIFNLKNNFDWRDRQEIDSKHTGELIIKKVAYDDGSKSSS